MRVDKCPICHRIVRNNLGKHIRNVHGEQEFYASVLKAKEEGVCNPEIGELFGITFRQLERIITETRGINISILNKPMYKDFGI